ncbi:MAG: hypothetical protein ACT4N8_04000 [Sphingosinicella sp.]|uniref:hypothetical protein n=1 Tax=Sphingosinicella sp. TaxID=1917971 RepID=UPI0040380625
MIGANKRRLWIGGAGLCLLGAAAAHAQEAGSNAIGPAQLRDFSLTPKQTIVRQPPPEARPAPRVAPPSPATVPPASPTAPERPAQPSAQSQRPPAATQPPSAPSEQPAAESQSFVPAPVPDTNSAPPAPIPAPSEAAPAPDADPGVFGYWAYGRAAAGRAPLGRGLIRRRRRREELAYAAAIEPIAAPAPVPAPPPVPRPDPVPRPWLELELKTIRASFSAVEAMVEFELSISNTGGSPARNLKIDVKMFNAGREQDQEIGAFFRTAGRESTKLNLPGIHHGATGVIQGEVAMPLEEMKAMKLDGRMLFVPVVAVNALYEWGEGRSGQSSKSYVVGRELETPSEKMGAFRVDQGPRIWRTVGQRQHKLARRV